MLFEKQQFLPEWHCYYNWNRLFVYVLAKKELHEALVIQEIYTSTGENTSERQAGPGARAQGFYLQLSKPSSAGSSGMETSQANWNESKRKERGLKYFDSFHKAFSQADPLLVAASVPPHWLGLPPARIPGTNSGRIQRPLQSQRSWRAARPVCAPTPALRGLGCSDHSQHVAVTTLEGALTFHQDFGDFCVAGTEGTVQLEPVSVVQEGSTQGEQYFLGLTEKIQHQ